MLSLPSGVASPARSIEHTSDATRPARGTAGALARYRVMAMVVGTGLAVLCFVGVPLQLAGDNKWPWTAVVEIVGPLHGFLYITYLIVCLDLAGRPGSKRCSCWGWSARGSCPASPFTWNEK